MTVAGNLTVGTDWQGGNVGNLRFASNGDGILTITAVADNTGLRTVNAEGTSGISFSGINAQNIDLIYGNIVLDLTGLGSDDAFFNMFEDGFAYASLFNLNEQQVKGELDSLQIVWGDEFDSEQLFSLLNDDFFGGNWNSEYLSASEVVWTNPSPASTVPEPATLIILGLGLTGLGFARRRK